MQKRLENGLLLIFTTALVATLGSLYFSEVRGPPARPIGSRWPGSGCWT